jgi:predicted nucleic acid-binding protein
VDTSVFIDFIRGISNEKVELLRAASRNDIEYGIASYTIMEALQGAKNEKEYEEIKEFLSKQRAYYLPETADTYDAAAHLFYSARRRGITPRNSIDVLIALIAIKNKLLLLHNDKDFDMLAEGVEELRILRAGMSFNGH